MNSPLSPNPSNQERYTTAVESLLTFLFDEFERLSLWNSAYQYAIQHSDDSITLKTEARQFAARDQYPLGIPKYSDLRQQAIQSFQDQNLDGLAAVISQLRERFFVWDGTQERTK